MDPRNAAGKRESTTAGDVHFELSLSLHAPIADRLDEGVLDGARRWVDRALVEEGASAPLLRRWRAILALPVEQVRAYRAGSAPAQAVIFVKREQL